MARKTTKKTETPKAQPAANANEFGYVEGEEFPYKIGDEFSGSPSQVSRFMKMVYSHQGRVAVEGNTVRITELPDQKETEPMTDYPEPTEPDPVPAPEPMPAPEPEPAPEPAPEPDSVPEDENE